MQNAGLYLCGAAGEGFFAFFWGRRLLELMLPEKIKLSGRAPSCRVSLGSRQRRRAAGSLRGQDMPSVAPLSTSSGSVGAQPSALCSVITVV